MNWLSHIGKQASRLASMELFRYIGPGFFVTVGFIDPGMPTSPTAQPCSGSSD